MRLLIVLTGAIGDVVRALPLLGRMRRARPESWIGWVVEPPAAPLLVGHPWLDEVLVFDRPAGLRAIPSLLARLRARRYDVALDLGRSAKTALFTRLAGAPLRLGFDRRDGREGSWLAANRRLAPQGPGRSKLLQFLAFGDLLGLPPTPVEFGLAATAAERADADSLLAGLPEPIVAACVGSSCPSRRWFPEPTAAVIDALAARHGASAVLLGSAADAPFAALVRRHAAAARDLTGRTSLRQLLAILTRMRLVFGADSGALHLAAALGKRVVSLWGATSAERSVPLGSEALVITGAAPCAPCFLRTCPIGRVCMREIAAARVLATVDGALDGRSGDS
ncbi:MAG: glycosyltransferase family 9 protein [Deltaproteobacteria bacterium]|nr:MAG: glycosyltransferase family 9 protein [Deltaproteobacteria bacterium]